MEDRHVCREVKKKTEGYAGQGDLARKTNNGKRKRAGGRRN